MILECLSLVFFFKQKTAYEIGVRLVGSEMCIRDRRSSPARGAELQDQKGVFTMGPWYYEVVSFDGDYVNLRRTDIESDELNPVALALLPPEIEVGSKIKCEYFQYEIIG